MLGLQSLMIFLWRHVTPFLTLIIIPEVELTLLFVLKWLGIAIVFFREERGISYKDCIKVEAIIHVFIAFHSHGNFGVTLIIIYGLLLLFTDVRILEVFFISR